MKKIIALTSGLFFALSLAFSAEKINEDELKSGQSDAIQFENYGGPHGKIESISAIEGIGVTLGKDVAASPEEPLAVQPDGKYSLYHVVNTEEESGFDADILFLNENAMVDHITNLRRIITGFLMSAYGYERENAESLAVFITVYNAVYRGNLENFSQKYKKAVLTYLTEDSVGLSTNWEEWAGKSQIVIPLGDLGEGTVSAVDTSEVSDENVIEAIRKEEDKGIDVRETLTEIKEKEEKNASEKAKTAQKEAAAEKKEGNTVKAEEAAKEATKQQTIADRKNEEIRTEKENIAQDKKEIQQSAAAALTEEKISYLTSLFVVDEKNHLYSLMTVNPKNGAVVKKSSLKQIREKTIYPLAGLTVQKDDGSTAALEEAYIAICGVKDKRSAIKLCIVDSKTLEIQKQSEEELSESSPLILQGDLYYVIVREDSKNYLAAFDKNLSLKKKSAVAINGASPLNIFSEGVLVTDEKGNPVLLQHSDFASVWAGQKSSTSDAK